MSHLPSPAAHHDPSKYLLVKDAADRAGLTPARIRQLIKSGDIIAINPGKNKTQVLIASLNDLIARRAAVQRAKKPVEVAELTTVTPRKVSTARPRGAQRTNRPHRRRYFGSIRQLPNGTFQACYTGPDKKIHNGPKPLLTERDASTWLDSVNTAITTGKWLPPLDIPGHYGRASDAPLFGQYATQ